MNTIKKAIVPENKKQRKPITRAEALRKGGKVALAAGTMMLLLNNPAKVLAQSAPGGMGDGDWGHG